LARTWATILTCRILAEQCCQGNHSHVLLFRELDYYKVGIHWFWSIICRALLYYLSCLFFSHLYSTKKPHCWSMNYIWYMCRILWFWELLFWLYRTMSGGRPLVLCSFRPLDDYFAHTELCGFSVLGWLVCPCLFLI
jgi:hypothetical protein